MKSSGKPIWFLDGMHSNPYLNYVEDEILTADPMKLVVLLYRGAIDAVGCARRHLAAGDISARSRSITKAMEIVAELVRSLDHERGGDISRDLSRLYDYLFTLLAAGNARQSDQPLAEAESLLSTLLTGWQNTASPVRAASLASPVHEELGSEEPRVSYAY